MRAVRFIRTLLVLTVIAYGGVLLYGYMRAHPQDLPWIPLDLTQPVGAFTGRKLAGIDAKGCRALLDQAGVRFAAQPPRGSGQCVFRGGVALRSGRALEIDYAPRGLATSCPVAAALALWEWHVVQPAALKHFGKKVARIDHLGSYNCRRIYGQSEGAWSEHATANAVDVAGFRLEGGQRISVLNDWDGTPAERAFLRDVRSGACDLFATVLSPDYNAAHRDHLHLDQAARGEMGWRGCR
ncbi:extensin family protein [Allosphingosinicella flava]|uniref:Extensin family protein n=1 Tax=Allosphingosinicella flava TaxID=2771430 RepID=A0A7T2LL82_9SPHN|nr:extensin family protein [Sphingosinicella flava]QPQ54250.1 extensin family protein [Sphingosinicella flava]